MHCSEKDTPSLVVKTQNDAGFWKIIAEFTWATETEQMRFDLDWDVAKKLIHSKLHLQKSVFIIILKYYNGYFIGISDK